MTATNCLQLEREAQRLINETTATERFQCKTEKARRLADLEVMLSHDLDANPKLARN
jgi:hypothetical protein